MGERFDQEMEKVKSITKYSKLKESLLSDMGTAYISNQFEGLDKSLIAVKSMRKALRAMGYSLREVEEYLLEHSYLTQTRIRKMFNESIYNEDCSIKTVVECVPFHTEQSTTDLIIEELKSRPALLKALKNGSSRQSIEQNHKVHNGTLLKSFYAKYADIIDD